MVLATAHTSESSPSVLTSAAWHSSSIAKSSGLETSGLGIAVSGAFARPLGIRPEVKTIEAASEDLLFGAGVVDAASVRQIPKMDRQE